LPRGFFNAHIDAPQTVYLRA